MKHLSFASGRLIIAACGVLLLACSHTPRAEGQELEPLAYSVSPVGVNIVGFGYGRSAGDLSFDPTLPIEDAEATINTTSLGYFRSIDFPRPVRERGGGHPLRVGFSAGPIGR